MHVHQLTFLLPRVESVEPLMALKRRQYCPSAPEVGSEYQKAPDGHITVLAAGIMR